MAENTAQKNLTKVSENLTVEDVIKALTENNGQIQPTAMALKITTGKLALLCDRKKNQEIWLARLKAVFYAKRGVVAAVAKVYGHNRRTVFRWIEQFRNELEETIFDSRELMGDLCESKIYQAIERGDAAMVRFYALTRMKNRGYSMRTEITGESGGPIQTIEIESQVDDKFYQLTIGYSNKNKK